MRAFHRTTPNGDPYTEIWMQAPTITCSVCGREDWHQWGLPVDSETGQIVSNDFEGEWGGIPACRECWAAHEEGAFVGTYPRF